MAALYEARDQADSDGKDDHIGADDGKRGDPIAVAPLP